MDINTLLDSLDQLFCWDMPEGAMVETVQAQNSRLSSDELGLPFCLD